MAGKYTGRKAKQQAEAEGPRVVTVRLVSPHEHEGVELQPGAIIDLRADQAERLFELERAIPYRRETFAD